MRPERKGAWVFAWRSDRWHSLEKDKPEIGQLVWGIDPFDPNEPDSKVPYLMEWTGSSYVHKGMIMEPSSWQPIIRRRLPAFAKRKK